jgi:glycosyltransferase involved in cell wall biosynthesis
MEPLISVVIPVYKTEKYVIKSVNSILTQTYKNLEVILVDDGSPDACPAICDELCKTDSRISVIHKENGGLSSARNAGIDKAQGKYILFLDSDDTLENYAIKDMAEKASEEKCDAVIPNTYYKIYDNSDKKVKSAHFTDDMFSKDPKIFALDVLIGKGRARRSTAVLYCLQIIKDNNIRYPLGRISEDFFFNLDFFSVADSIALYDKPSLNNLKRDGSISASYYENFFDTVLEMDVRVEEFIGKIDSDKYRDYIYGRRETLLYRNILIFAINVMGSSKTSYHKRVLKCVSMFKNERLKNALESGAGTPFFEGKFQRFYMGFSLKLIRMKLYRLTCLLAFVAARINTV